MNVYFSDYFEVDPNLLEQFGAFNISLINDLPLFVDPFLLFESDKEEYQKLHKNILEYVAFLRDMSQSAAINEGLLKSWFIFSEVKQNWLGFSLVGNNGRGLGHDFANALKSNLHTVFSDFGNETVTKDSHLEKLCIIKAGVGKDSISDFTVNLIKEYLCEYTELFAKKYISPTKRTIISVKRVSFDYNTHRWKPRSFELPYIEGDFVLLTPKDILTKDENWINSSDIFSNFKEIADSVSNDQLRESINFYFHQNLPKITKKKKKITKREYSEAVSRVISMYPEFLDHYIRYKEDNGEQAKSLSKEKVEFIENVFIDRLGLFIKQLKQESAFYDTFQDSLERVKYLKQVIENNDGYKIFYVDGTPLKREKDIQIMFRLTWYATPANVSSEVNDGRGPVDYNISMGKSDKTLVEFKLASNTKLRQNLEHQVEVYKKAAQTNKDIKAILFFSYTEEKRVKKILNDLGLQDKENIVLIDARNDNKISASNVK